MESKISRILAYLMDNSDGLTVASCQRIFHTTELRSIVNALRLKGFNVQSEWMLVKDRSGLNHRFKRYYINKEELYA